MFVGVNHAYVTTIGRLIGVVGLKELRKAIEDVNHHHGQPNIVDGGKQATVDIDDDTDDDNNNDDVEVDHDNKTYEATVTSLDTIESTNSSEKDEREGLMNMNS